VAAKRQTVIALTAGASIVLALGVLASINTDRPDPQAVKTELQAKMVQLDEINDPIMREKFAKELLANDLYRDLAKALYGKLERAFLKIREAANLERAAMKEIPPFLARCKDLPRVPYHELDALHGEANSLLRNYATTRYGEELRRLVEDLKARCAIVIRAGSIDVLALRRDAFKLANEGRFAPAYALILEFEKKYVNAMEFESQLREMKEQVLRRAETALPAPGSLKDPDARKKALERLEGPDFKGLPLPALEAAVRELKRR